VWPAGRLEAVGRELDQQPERVAEVDRVHEAAVLDAAVLDPALVEPLDRLPEHPALESAKATWWTWPASCERGDGSAARSSL
jgi:hypothetical protein